MNTFLLSFVILFAHHLAFNQLIPPSPNVTTAESLDAASDDLQMFYLEKKTYLHCLNNCIIGQQL